MATRLMTNRNEDSWEARMAARASQRAATTPAPEVPDDDTLCIDHPWLHGWPRINRGRAVLIGTATHCVCCGRFRGVTCVAFPPDWKPPGPEPVWPFGEDDCPLCSPYPPYS